MTGRFVTKQDVNLVLRGAYTEQGIELWWTRPRSQLGGAKPEDYFKRGLKAREEVLLLAESGLDMTAT